MSDGTTWSNATMKAEPTPTFDSLREALHGAMREGVASLYLDAATLRRLAAEATREGATDSGTFMGTPYFVSPNVDGWCFVDSEGNVLAAGPAGEPATKEGEGDG